VISPRQARIGMALCIFGAAPALANPVLENEIDGAAINNLRGSAQSLPDGAFTANVNPLVFGNIPTASVTGRAGGSDIDFYSFNSPGGFAWFDIDGGAAFDSYVAVFSADGTLLGDNDDSFPTDPGSSTDLDAFLGMISLTGAGQYFVAVASASNTANASFTGSLFTELARPDGEFGGYAFGGATPGDSSFTLGGPQAGAEYTLHISLPAPASVALLAVGIVGFRRRR